MPNKKIKKERKKRQNPLKETRTDGNKLKLTGIGKVTLKLEPEVYRLSASQTEKYDKNIIILRMKFIMVLVQEHLLHPVFVHLDIFLSTHFFSRKTIFFCPTLNFLNIMLEIRLRFS